MCSNNYCFSLALFVLSILFAHVFLRNKHKRVKAFFGCIMFLLSITNANLLIKNNIRKSTREFFTYDSIDACNWLRASYFHDTFTLSISKCYLGVVSYCLFETYYLLSIHGWKKLYLMSEINNMTLRRGNIDIDPTSTQNYNICYIGSSLIKVFQIFSSFTTSNASLQFMLSSFFNFYFITHNYASVVFLWDFWMLLGHSVKESELE